MAKPIPNSVNVSPLTDTMYGAALKGAKRETSVDVVVARYDGRGDTLNLTLRNGIVVRLPRFHIRELADARAVDMRKIEIQPGGDGISFRSIDVDIYVPGLLADELGPLFAKALGKRSKGRTSAKKRESSRANGRKGGRPRKVAA